MEGPHFAAAFSALALSTDDARCALLLSRLSAFAEALLDCASCESCCGDARAIGNASKGQRRDEHRYATATRAAGAVPW